MPDLRAPFLLLALTACGYPPPPADELPEEYVTCAAPDECQVVEFGCCDACNGGEARAIRKDHADEARRRYQESCAFGVTCTLVACAPLRATCTDGRCALAQDTDAF